MLLVNRVRKRGSVCALACAVATLMRHCVISHVHVHHGPVCCAAFHSRVVLIAPA